MAPEIHEVLTNRENFYDAFKADIFSLGVIMFALVLGRLPFEYATKDDKIYKLIAEQDY
jgi:serine/threonine protein kinase